MTFSLWQECDGGFGCTCKDKQERAARSRRNLLGHGTRAKYQRGCRCTPCRSANAKYHREYARSHR